MTQIESERPSSTSEEDRRRQILEAATDLFLEFGYDRTTLDMLIERIGGSRRAIYNYFGSKEGLLEAIVCERCACLSRDIEALALEKSRPRETLLKLGMAAVCTILSPTGVKLFRLVVQESVRHPEFGRMMYESGIATSKDLLAQYFKRETRAKRLNVRHPDEAASMFFAMIKGDLHFIALFWGFETLTEAYFKQRVERSVDIFLSGIQGDTAH